MKFMLAVGGLVLALAGGAGAQTVISPDSDPGLWQRWIDRAKMPTPSIALKVIAQPCFIDGQSVAGCTYPGTQTVNVMRGPQWATKELFLHEVGHQVDFRTMSAATREQFTQIAALVGEWSDGVDEVFADTYAQCALGNWVGAPGKSLTPDLQETRVILRMRQACFFFRHLPSSPANTTPGERPEPRHRQSLDH